jgi:hypothetical protein
MKLIKTRTEMVEQIVQLGGTIPPQEEWEDPVDYNDRLLAILETLKEPK